MTVPAHDRAQLTHVARPSRDIDATIAFYRDFVGLSVVHEREDDGVRVVWLGERPRGNDFVLVFIGVSPPPAAAHFADHLGYDVSTRDQVDVIAERARRLGILEVPPTDGGEVVGYYCMVRDPDGNLVEFSHGQPIDIPASSA
jgi:catechol 2,3-dioxygenase-like lactoylglutathione lyase family enzyme